MTDARRGKRLALTGVFLQAAFCAVALGLWIWTRADSAMAALWFLAAGIPLWLMTAFLFYCRQLAEREAREIEEITQHGGQEATIFERPESLEQRPAARRLAWAEKWIAPSFTLLWAAIQALIAVLVGGRLLAGAVAGISNAGQGAVFLIAPAVAAFLFSYYCLGMARESQWRPLRAGGSYLLVNSLALAAGGAALLLAHWKQYLRPDDIVATIITGVQLLLAVELVLNFVLDLYRPRLPGQEHRFSFDSRLFNVLAEPGKVGHSLAETMNYQFGFEVSKTWFYQLVSKAMVPLLITAAGILVAMSSIVVVRNGETYVVRRWGRFLPGQAPLGPGLHVKYPWPIETAERFDVGAVHEVLLGAGDKRSEAERRTDFITTTDGNLEVSDWSRSHGAHEELDFLIAVPPAKRVVGEKASSPVNVIKLVVIVQYVVDPNRLSDYAYRFIDPQQMLECLAYRELTRSFASATLDTPVEGDANGRPQKIMTSGRGEAEQSLRRSVQEQADTMALGVRLVYVGFQGVHPPPAAADDYEKVFKAQREMEQKRFEAEKDAAKTLSGCAGSPGEALLLALAIQKLQELESLGRLRADTAAFAAQRDVLLRDLEAGMEVLREEVAQERLEGKLRKDRLTDRQKLLAAQESYHGLLRSLEAPADLPGAVLAAASREADARFAQAVGQPAATVAAAEASRWRQEMSNRGQYEAVRVMEAAFQANPTVFMWDQWLGVWEEALPNLHKYVLAVDRNKIEVWLNWERESQTLENLFPEAGKKEEKK